MIAAKFDLLPTRLVYADSFAALVRRSFRGQTIDTPGLRWASAMIHKDNIYVSA